jgi:hypothetical protein
MNKYKHLIFSLIVIFSASSLVNADSPATPWSQVIPSKNEKYVLVLISPKVKEQEDYIFQSREFWRKGGIPAEDVPEAEKALQKEIDEESAVRKKYADSGLYTNGKIPKLLWKVDFYDLRAWVKVSDDAEHIIVGKWAISGITEEKPLEYNPSINEVIRVYPNMDEIILTFYSMGKPLHSYKASELINIDENMRRNTNNDFMWSDEGVLNEDAKTLSIIKKNGEKLIFDLNGKILSGKPISQRNSDSNKTDNIQLPQSENNKSFCGGIGLLFGMVLLLFLDVELSKQSK